jgi:hypothetical protein
MITESSEVPRFWHPDECCAMQVLDIELFDVQTSLRSTCGRQVGADDVAE